MNSFVETPLGDWWLVQLNHIVGLQQPTNCSGGPLPEEYKATTTINVSLVENEKPRCNAVVLVKWLFGASIVLLVRVGPKVQHIRRY